jgi:hypothetical protein
MLQNFSVATDRIANLNRGADAPQYSGTQIFSIVCVVDGRGHAETAALAELHAMLLSLEVPGEIVVVMNGIAGPLAPAFREFVTQLEQLRVYVMKHRVDHTTAIVAGIENAIGDWVATMELGVDSPQTIRALFESALREQAEVVLSVAPAGRQGVFASALSALYHKAFEMLHGFKLRNEAPSARLLSRAVVNALLKHDSPLVAVETLTATGGYRKVLVTCERRQRTGRSLGERVRTRWRTLIGINATPLRLANLLCGIGACTAVCYSVYVVAVYLLKDDVIPGWTTVSLMLSGMFFMLALVLWLMSEYMLMYMDAGARRPRYDIVDEFGGEQRPFRKLLNVETEL